MPFQLRCFMMVLELRLEDAGSELHDTSEKSTVEPKMDEQGMPDDLLDFTSWVIMPSGAS